MSNPATDGSFSSDCDLSVNILAYDTESSAQTTLQVSAISCIRDTMVTTTFIHTVANCVWQQYDFYLWITVHIRFHGHVWHP